MFHIPQYSPSVEGEQAIESVLFLLLLFYKKMGLNVLGGNIPLSDWDESHGPSFQKNAQTYRKIRGLRVSQ